MGEGARFRHPPGIWSALVRVIRAAPNDLLGNVRAGGLQFDILAGDIAFRPVRDDEIKIEATGAVHVVESAEPDDLGLSYRLVMQA